MPENPSPPSALPCPAPRRPGEPVAVWLSGGVDSGLVLALLRRAGYAPVAIHLRLHDADPGGAAAAARGLAERLDTPFHEFDLAAAFDAVIRRPFIDGYRRGRTMNPCVECNPAIKLGLAVALARQQLGLERFATGHYARLAAGENGAVRLARAKDARRDQSYFLYRLPPELLPHLIFPLGEANGKTEVRAAAAAFGLIREAEAPDSQDICFLPGGNYRDLLPAAPDDPDDPRAAGLVPGPLVDSAGALVGRHNGLARYTPGQRKGLGAHREPRYVVALRPRDNTVAIGSRAEAVRRRVVCVRPVAHAAGLLVPGTEWRGKIRSAGALAPCEVAEADPERLVVDFAAPVFAPAPGQHLVLYDAADRVAGGGEIGNEQ